MGVPAGDAGPDAETNAGADTDVAGHQVEPALQRRAARRARSSLPRLRRAGTVPRRR